VDNPTIPLKTILLAIIGSGIEKFELRSAPAEPRRGFYGMLYLSVSKSGKTSDPGGAVAVFDNPSL
jgi:hypothetical protein